MGASSSVMAKGKLLARVLASAEGNGRLEELVEAIARRELDPHTAAERLIETPDHDHSPSTTPRRAAPCAAPIASPWA